MYLDPLADIVAANGGLVYNASRYARLCDSVTMMVDVKQVRRKRELNPPTTEGMITMLHLLYTSLLHHDCHVYRCGRPCVHAPVQGGGAMDPNSSFVVLHSILSEYQGVCSDALRSCLSPVSDLGTPTVTIRPRGRTYALRVIS